jgi:glycosyltransferase involved in cell wall biosynthesis
MKVAIIHEFLYQYGGAEKVLESLHELFPNAPIYTLVYEPKYMPVSYQSWDIRQSPYLKGNLIRKYYKFFFIFYPIFVEQFDLREYDLVISSSYAYTHGIVTSPGTCHVCYCHTPMRFVWVKPEDYRHKIPKIMHSIYDLMIHYLRVWDYAVSQRADSYIAASCNISERIKKYYQRESTVIFPPVDINQSYLSNSQEEYYLLVSRLVLPYKCIDIAIHAFNQLGNHLKIIGEGSDKDSLQKMANPNIEFLGYLSGKELGEAYAQCKALIFPGEDDFGIVPLEANTYGRPVIAYRGGGILETQIEDITAIYFDELTPNSLINAIRRFESLSFNSEQIRKSTNRFDKDLFKHKVFEFIELAITRHHSQYKFRIIHS